ncbi:von Willebrand factor [Gossypium arboreum]|uniref:von Willebrand factor n=1 Tax=Gossypium arboreum TaxID=29729 RepID=A0A0B0N9E9_GOSAR|nr:von Willebrand factor [Gossypium arboreum]
MPMSQAVWTLCNSLTWVTRPTQTPVCPKNGHTCPCITPCARSCQTYRVY